MTVHWLVSTTLACICWSLSDICCDICISSRDKETTSKITPEANSIVCGIISGIIGVVAIIQNESVSTIVSYNSMLIMLSGSIHFGAYRLILYAYEMTDSTVITPLLQLSAVWMVLLSIVISYFGYSSYNMEMRDVVAIMLIFVGGILPATGGNITYMFKKQFWSKKAVKYCIIAELMVCLYSISIHHLINKQQVPTIVLFGLTRIGNSIMCGVFLTTSKPYRVHLKYLLEDMDYYYINITSFGIIISIVGLWLSNISYGVCSNPSIVNATEGGLQQLINLSFSLIINNINSGDSNLINLPLKCISLVMIITGLTLTI